MKKNIYSIVILILISCNIVFAQRVEIGVFGGGSYYLGDLNPRKQFELTQPAFGGLVRYNIDPRLALKINGFYGNVVGNDAITKSSDFAVNRNLNFKSHIFEFSTQLELNFMPYVTGHNDYYFSPYIFAGISIFNFNPKTQYNGEWIALQPLGTEGQGTIAYHENKPYNLTAVGIPFGIGFKYSMSKSVCFGAEWGIRKTNTDYLDDVSTTYADPNILAAENGLIAAELADRSVKLPGEPHKTGLQRGNSQNKDWYSFFGAFVTFKISHKRKGDCPTYRSHKRYKDYYIE